MSSRGDITRRDFLSGVALSLAAGTSLSPLELLAASDKGARYYPPALTGMRGSHVGSFEVAHAVAWQGAHFGKPGQQTDSDYDLIIVGGGISGLAAAFLWQQRHGGGQKILILENHDDFGGHAKRNEFDVDGTKLLGYGGSETLENPSRYSKVAKNLLEDIGVDFDAFYDYYDLGYYERFGLAPGIHFNKQYYGRDVTTMDPFSVYHSIGDTAAMDAIERFPMSEQSKADLRRLYEDEVDHLAQFDIDEKIRLLLTTPYSEYLRKYVGVTDEVVSFLRDADPDSEGAGWDATSAEAAWWNEMPGMYGVDLGNYREDEYFEEDPYIHHFPDGNATIARALVQHLVPGAVHANSLEELLTASLDYSQLDQPAHTSRIRLNATAVDIRHTPDGKLVETVYVKDGQPARVRGKHLILACYNTVIPHICADIDSAQREALDYAEKTPMVYTTIAMRHWRHLAELGLWGVYVPNSPLAQQFYFEFPVSVGDYRFATGPDDPALIRAICMMRKPDQGLTQREQHRAGRQRLLEMSFDDHERILKEQLHGAFGSAGFDVERDIAAITVNRWPHGYSYYYNSLSDPLEYTADNGPHILGRAQVGRISIANADSTGSTYIDAAIDAADRAVTEQMK